jgi:gluconate:H+ symporter, GntP family
MHWLQHETGGLVTLALASIALLLFLIIKVKLQPFVALLICSIVVALVAGLSVDQIVGTVQNSDQIGVVATGFGNIMGSVGVIIGLGSMLGAMLEASGAADALTARLIGFFGEKRAPLAMGLAGLLFGIPVFFDVGVFVLAPLAYVAARRSGRSLLLYCLPMLAGLSITHALIPPHPGPVAAAGLLHVGLGQMLLTGAICGIPAWLAAVGYAWWVGERLFVPIPEDMVDAMEAQRRSVAAARRGNPTPTPVSNDSERDETPGSDSPSAGASSAGAGSGGASSGGLPSASTPSAGAGSGELPSAPDTAGADPSGSGERAAEPVPGFGTVMVIIVTPLILILLATFSSIIIKNPHDHFRAALALVGSPFVALTVALLLAFYLLGIRLGWTRDSISEVTTAGMRPLGMILLVVGAGGVFGAVLSATGVGKALASSMSNAGLPLIVLAYVIAAGLRLAQGSATVAIVAAAAIVEPLVAQGHYSQTHTALIATAIGAGSVIASHVNDGGFWIVSRYFGISVKDTLKTWTVLETILSVVSFGVAALLSVVV